MDTPWSSVDMIELEENVSLYLKESHSCIIELQETVFATNNYTLLNESALATKATFIALMKHLKDKVIQLFTNFIDAIDHKFTMTYRYLEKYKIQIEHLTSDQLHVIAIQYRQFHIPENIPVMLNDKTLGLPIVNPNQLTGESNIVHEFLESYDDRLNHARAAMLGGKFANGSFQSTLDAYFNNNERSVRQISQTEVKDMISSIESLYKVKKSMQQSKQEFLSWIDTHQKRVEQMTVSGASDINNAKGNIQVLQYKRLAESYLSVIITSYIQIYREKMNAIHEKFNQDRNLLIPIVKLINQPKQEGHPQ